MWEAMFQRPCRGCSKIIDTVKQPVFCEECHGRNLTNLDGYARLSDVETIRLVLKPIQNRYSAHDFFNYLKNGGYEIVKKR